MAHSCPPWSHNSKRACTNFNTFGRWDYAIRNILIDNEFYVLQLMLLENLEPFKNEPYYGRIPSLVEPLRWSNPFAFAFSTPRLLCIPPERTWTSAASVTGFNPIRQTRIEPNCELPPTPLSPTFRHFAVGTPHSADRIASPESGSDGDRFGIKANENAGSGQGPASCRF